MRLVFDKISFDIGLMLLTSHLTSFEFSCLFPKVVFDRLFWMDDEMGVIAFLNYICPKRSEISNLSPIYNCFLMSMIKNSFKRMNDVGLKENFPWSDPIDWLYNITNISLYKIYKYHIEGLNSDNNNQNGDNNNSKTK